MANNFDNKDKEPKLEDRYSKSYIGATPPTDDVLFVGDDAVEDQISAAGESSGQSYGQKVTNGILTEVTRVNRHRQNIWDGFGAVSTLLDGAINSSVTTITVDDASQFTAEWGTYGKAQIDSEVISFTGTTATTLTGVTRGIDGTTAASHSDNATVTEVQVQDVGELSYPAHLYGYGLSESDSPQGAILQSWDGFVGLFVEGGGEVSGNTSNAGMVGGNGNSEYLVLRFDVDTAAYTIHASQSVTVDSTRKIKENIKPLRNGLSIINNLEPVQYNKKGQKKKHLGLIAEDVHKVIPVISNGKTVTYEELIPVLIRSVQELSAEVDKLKKPWWKKLLRI